MFISLLKLVEYWGRVRFNSNAFLCDWLKINNLVVLTFHLHGAWFIELKCDK